METAVNTNYLCSYIDQQEEYNLKNPNNEGTLAFDCGICGKLFIQLQLG
jgi:hypothetical protein